VVFGGLFRAYIRVSFFCLFEGASRFFSSWILFRASTSYVLLLLRLPFLLPVEIDVGRGKVIRSLLFLFIRVRFLPSYRRVFPPVGGCVFRNFGSLSGP